MTGQSSQLLRDPLSGTLRSEIITKSLGEAVLKRSLAEGENYGQCPVVLSTGRRCCLASVSLLPPTIPRVKARAATATDGIGLKVTAENHRNFPST